MYTTKQTAQHLGVSIGTLRRLIRTGKIGYYRVSPGKLGFTPEEIAAYLARNAQPANARTAQQLIEA